MDWPGHSARWNILTSQMDISTLLTHRQYYRYKALRMDRPGNPAQWNISRLWPLPVKSPAQSLDYHANSYHIHLNTLGFHGYGEEISQICPYTFCPINSSFSGTPSSLHHSTALTPLFWRRRFSRAPRTPTKPFLHQLQSLRSSFSRGDGHQLCCPRGQFIILSLVFSPYPCSSAIYFTEHSYFFLLFFFLPQKPLGSVQ